MLLRLPWSPKPQPPPILTLEDVERISAANAAAVVSSTLATIESRPEVQFARRNAAMSQAFAMSNPDPFRTNADPQFRPLSNVSVATLRTLARSYDVLAACIAHLKDQVIRTPLQIVAKDDKDKSKATAAAIDEAQKFFDVEGGMGGVGEYLQDFEGKWLDDLIVIGCMALTLGYKTVGSKADTNPDTIQAIDSSTIKPLVTPAGFAPEMDQPAYDQYVMGTQHGRYTRDEIIYRSLPIFNRNDTPYATSAVELLVMVVSTALQSDNWNRTWLTDGNVPDMLVVTPETWTPQQIIEYQDYFDTILAGNSRQRHKAKLVPHGTTSTSQTRKDADFQAFEAWLRDRTCSLTGVNPTSIGYGGNTYKVSQEGANDQTRENRVAQLLMFRAALYTDICRRKGWTQLVVKDKETDTEDALSKAQRFQILVGFGARTIDETRQEDGLEPLPDGAGATPLLAAGMITLDSVLNPPEPPPASVGPAGMASGALDGSGAQGGPADGKGGGSGTPPKPKGGSPKIMTALRADSLSRADDAESGHWVTIDGEHVFIKDDATLPAASPSALTSGPKGHSATEAAKMKEGDTVTLDGHTGMVTKVTTQMRNGVASHPTDPSSLVQAGYQYPVTTVTLHHSNAQISQHTFGGVNHADTRALIEASHAHLAANSDQSRLDEILGSARDRMKDTDPLSVNLNPNEAHWMTPDERREVHDIKSRMPTFGQEREAARERLRAKVHAARADLAKWERKALNRIRDGKPAACRFESEAIDEDAAAGIMARLGECATADDVRRVFADDAILTGMDTQPETPPPVTRADEADAYDINTPEELGVTLAEVEADHPLLAPLLRARTVNKPKGDRVTEAEAARGGVSRHTKER